MRPARTCRRRRSHEDHLAACYAVLEALAPLDDDVCIKLLAAGACSIRLDEIETLIVTIEPQLGTDTVMTDNVHEENDPGNNPLEDDLAAIPPKPNDKIDRREIRRSRRAVAKKAKIAMQHRYNHINEVVPIGSHSADQILRIAVALYKDGPISRHGLRTAISKLESDIRCHLPDIGVLRSPRSLSMKPERVGLMVFVARTINEQQRKIVSAENYSIILEEGRIVFILGRLPGGADPHLFKRVFERDSRKKNFSQILLKSSDIWPTLLWMRAEQSRHSRMACCSEVLRRSRGLHLPARPLRWWIPLVNRHGRLTTTTAMGKGTAFG